MDVEALIHFLGGAIGGTAGTALTCPLEVIKTRLQSSQGFHPPPPPAAASKTSPPPTPNLGPSTSKVSSRPGPSTSSTKFTRLYSSFLGARTNRPLFHFRHGTSLPFPATPSEMLNLRRLQLSGVRLRPKINLFTYVRDIVRTEGVSALYKGLLPNLVGVTPSKAVYFYAYSSFKRIWNESGILVPNSAMVHMVSAGSAGFVTATMINPIWLVKTRLQLHHGPLSVSECIKRVYTREGMRGFYRGVTASYMGISETIIQFVLYENFRSNIELQLSGGGEENGQQANSNKKFYNFMLAGGLAKFLACLVTYPHEVVRTRLREQETKGRGFFAILIQLGREGGLRGLYRGLSVQLLRSVPNTAITMGTYEIVVQFLHGYAANYNTNK